MKRIKHLLPWIVLFIYWPLVFTSTHIPRLPQLRIYGHDVTLHITAYLILTLLYWLARYGRERPGFGSFKVYGVILLMAIYGAVDEITQKLVNRHSDFYDWLSDMGGCVLAIAALYLLRRARHWLIIYWMVMFAITHWPGEAPFVKLPSFWQQFEVAYIMAGYLILTLLWWRSLCQEGRFIINKSILLTTLYVLLGYAVLDEAISMAMGRGYD
ncbi:VanZ family protein, partial [Planctomycetota bacterium]